MGPQESQGTTSLSTPSISYDFCESCSCQRCRRIRSNGRCGNCKCSECVDVLEYLSSDETSDEKISDNEKLSEIKDSMKSFVTPQKRITTKSLSTQQREAVRDAARGAAPELRISEAKSLGFCLVSLMTDYSTCLQTCHIIPRNLMSKDSVMTVLEYSWGLKYRGLNLNSRYNMMNLEASLHLSFDRGHWALLPVDNVYIKKLNNAKFTIEDPIEAIYGDGEKSFRYAFLPFPTMERPILRLGNNDLTQHVSVTNPVTVHYPPYDQLPILNSHVKPHFVIWNLVTKIRETQCDIRKIPQALKYHNRATLTDIVGIYDDWMKAKVPPNFREWKDIATSSDSEGSGEGNIGSFDGSRSRELGDNTLNEANRDKGRRTGYQYSAERSSRGRYQTRSLTTKIAGLNIATSSKIR